MLKLYLVHPITGLSYDEVIQYYTDMIEEFGEFDGFHPATYDLYYPMIGKAYLRNEKELKAGGYQIPPSTNHAIFGRDKWMVGQADVVYADLIGAKTVSIGCVMELAWANMKRKHVVVAMEASNPHRHAFVLEAADIIYETSEEAIQYLKKLAKRSI